MDSDKRILALRDRLNYAKDIVGDGEGRASVTILEAKFQELLEKLKSDPEPDSTRDIAHMEGLFDFLEMKLDQSLSPMDKVRIVRHPQRICLKDILENVYDNYSEIGGQGEFSIDPSMVIARAYLTRRVGQKVFNQSVMVIGQEKGHGEEFRNGGSVKPWGNAKALHYMKVAETENIPVHSFIFTPGSYPIEDYPGAAQQIAKNLYEMAALRVPVIATISEGGSGGAEAIGLADRRIMLSHGYYSVISPEGAAAIEGRLRDGNRAGAELVEKCARQLGITAEDNLNNGYVDRVLNEPPLGARPNHYNFFKDLRRELIQSTNEAVLGVKSMQLFRSLALKQQKRGRDADAESIFVRWSLSKGARTRLVEKRWDKFRHMSQHAYRDNRSVMKRVTESCENMGLAMNSFVRHDLLGRHKKKLDSFMEEVAAEVHLVSEKLVKPVKKLITSTASGDGSTTNTDIKKLTRLSRPEEGAYLGDDQWLWISPRSRDDKTISCPNVRTHGCQDVWAPDLFGEFAGVCPNCGHHFRMEYQWYLHNVFDYPHAHEFGREIESVNPLDYEGFQVKIDQARERTGLNSACITFETNLKGIDTVVAVLTAPFRGGTVGAAEGEKFIRACERAMKRRYPLIAYVHGTAGIRIQEGVNGVIQMPRCTQAVRRYIDAGGLYLVVYDTNSYAGPLASFLGCSPYQFAIRSTNIGFAGPGVITETTGIEVPPNYHKAYHALSRGHIHGIWDRRELKGNLHRALLTMGGRNLYYR
ncbi:acetyl-CoA carboxylase carboxyl transferase subunit alpha/beta [Desulfovibrio oxyclinae]|uniref:acetyl-CoA carboxylase carboxyl transferase subunit alpha/beta n=1 Tax=Desulfovibrio oxyclinae TaxID=63560 RepID=UPI00036C70C4|nr:acetyl-CoA carboxylase carboxyl transferase subunit alpha/beta [Desulfovibrio oxyclinae]